MLHNKFTKAGTLPNKFTDYVSITYVFAKLKIGVWKLDLYKKLLFCCNFFTGTQNTIFFIGTEICLQ